MPVRNPAKQASKGRTTPYTPDQEPTTARGKRRSNKTPEYLQNLEDRKAQIPGIRVRSGKGARGPTKGPTKRPQGVSNRDWADYMSGNRDNLPGL